MAKGKYQEWITEEGLSRISKWAESGLTDTQIAHNMNIGVSTLNGWKRKYPQIMESLKKSKAVADKEVENALYKSALGYYVEETEFANKWNPKEKEYELILTKKTGKWIKPDTTAQIFWLKNRDPEHWRDRVEQRIETDADGDNAGIIILPSRIPLAPPEDVTDREQIIGYYEKQFQEGIQQNLKEQDD